MRIVCLAFATVLIAGAPAAAQTLELGGSIGIGIRGRDGSAFGRDSRVMSGVHASVWWEDRLETGFRVAWQELPQQKFAATYFYGCVELDAAGRCRRPAGSFRVISDRTSPRTFLNVVILYHFLPGEFARPFVGAGMGGWRETEFIRCEVPGCEALRPTLSLGPRTEWRDDLAPTAGISVTLARRLVVRGGFALHNLFAEEWSTFESFLAIGYRF